MRPQANVIVRRPCDAHRIVFGDATPRPCRFCALCRAWLCDDCRGRYDLRALAALRSRFSRGPR